MNNWNVNFSHWNCGKVGNNQSYNKLEWLKFAKLPFAHKPKNNQNNKVDDYTSNKKRKHIFILIKFIKFIYF